MYIETVPNRRSPPAILLREGWRENGKVRKRTLANLTDWPTAKVEALRAVLKGAGAVTTGTPVQDSFEIVRSLPHGHVAAVIGTLNKLALANAIDSQRSRMRALAVAMVVARIIDPRSKLATARGFDEETAWTTLSSVLGIEHADEDDLYAAMDWLLERQERVERKLAKKYLEDGALVLYDVTSTYFEGRTCPIAKLGHSRDGRRDKLQIVIGLMCNAQGCPVAVEVFSGNTADPSTLQTQIDKVRKRFSLSRVVLVGDRGMLTEARIREDLRPVDGLDWITALRAPALAKLVASGSLQIGLFDQTNLAEITAPEFPDERLVVCRNPRLAKERARKREDLLAATEVELGKIREATRRPLRRLTGKDKIGVRVGKVIGRRKMEKHFDITITDDSLEYSRKVAAIEKEAALDGFYAVRTSVPRELLDDKDTVAAYKGLSVVERAFRCQKTVDLKIRPIYHRLETRVRAHVFLCMLAYHVEWHMRKALAPIIFDDDDPEAAAHARDDIVSPAQRSRKAHAKAASKRTASGLPVHSFQTLLQDLATITKNRICPKGGPDFDVITRPTSLQQTALDLLNVSLSPN